LTQQVRRQAHAGSQAAQGYGGDNTRLKKLLAEQLFETNIIKDALRRISPHRRRSLVRH
jgi:hypothetical protein